MGLGHDAVSVSNAWSAKVQKRATCDSYLWSLPV